MGSAALGRKVSPPTIPIKHVPRPRLTKALDRAVELPFTLIAAGPGWGKTVLLSEWVHQRAGPVVWMSLDPGDDHDESFWRLFRAALDKFGSAEDLDSPPDPLQSSGEMALEQLDHVLGACSDPLVLVLDNFHLVTSAEVLNTVGSLMLSPLPKLRLVVAARSDPLLPVHRARIAGQLSELRAGDLAMDRQEIEGVLATHGVGLTALEMATLATRTEGWAAGLKLSVMRMEGNDNPGEFVTEFALDQGSIGEYLTLEVLASQDAATRHLLIRTSIVDEVCGSLADAMTGSPDSGETLARLAETNSFVTTDRENSWFRYHPLLQEVLKHLQANDSRETKLQLHHRAAEWYDEHGHPLDGLRHALLANDRPHSLDLLGRGAFEATFLRFGRQPIEGIARLFEESLPAHDTTDDIAWTRLRTATAAAVAAISGAADASRSALDRLRVSGDPTADPTDEAEDSLSSTFMNLAELILAFRSGDLESAERAGDALGSAEDRPVLRAAADGMLGAARYWDGDLSGAGRALDQSVERALQCDAPAIAVNSLGMLTMLRAVEGRSPAARHSAEQALTLVRSSRTLRGGTVAALHLGSAHLALLNGDLSAYQDAMRRTAVELASSDDAALIYGAGLLEAKALILVGHFQQARDLLLGDSFHTTSTLFNLPGMRQVLLSEAVIGLGKPATALKSLSAIDAGMGHMVEIARARADLALGRHELAESRIRRVISSSNPAARLPVLLDAVLLGAVIADNREDEPTAAEAVSRAIDLGTTDRIVLPFLEAAPHLGDLLRRHVILAERWPVSVTTPYPTIVAPARLPSQRAGNADDRPEYFEQLTDRELSILRWLTTTMTTAEIADELFVSINTVKTHIAAVYRKLGAGKRREAIDRARELQLI